jgi:glucose/arabinose dehydrogenase
MALPEIPSVTQFTFRICHIALFVTACVGATIARGEEKPAVPKTSFECRWTEETMTLDGAADEPAWQRAELIDDFYLPWLRENQRPPKTKTTARLLWDRQYLYFFADLEDTDLYADVTEHDGETWNNDVFELFFKPSEEHAGYYELQVNAAGTVMDMFLPRRGAGGFRRFINDGDFHLEAKVRQRGTLNRWQDKDQGWSVEGRMPWHDFIRTGGRPAIGEEWKFALCRYDYSVEFEGPDLSTCAPLKSRPYPDFHHHEDYATLKFVGPRQQSSVRPYGIEKRIALTTSRVVGSPDPPTPYVVERALPKLKLSWPIFVINEPCSRRLIFIDQNRSYGPSRICRTSDDPASGEYEVLLELKDTAYSIAFHPNFKQNGFMYVGGNEAPVGGGPKRSYVKRYTIEREPPQKFDPESAKLIIDWESDGHNGAAIAFGLDGMLFVTSGDGTSDSDTNLKGQGLDHLLAKVLRIDVDHPDQGRAYSVPSDNPFVGMKDARPETWAYGFRNPWRATVDPVTGNLWIGNNGQDLWEQAYLVERGANYGWSVYEGSHPFYLTRQSGPTPHVNPTLEHHHSESRSLTGGVVYYGNWLPELRGAYIYGDHSTGKIWGAKVDGTKVVWHQELVDTTFNITAFALDADGELLIADHRGEDKGGFYRLKPRPKETPSADFPRKLSDSGLFRSVASYRVDPALIPYSVNSPLWSDGAYKERHIALPGADSTFDFTTSGSWDLPDKTVLVKSFALETVEGDPSTRRWIETRFLVKQQGEWAGYSYQWNDEQTDAALVGKDGVDKDFYIKTASGSRRQPWRFPSRTECMVCHSRAAKFVLGLSTEQMNRDHDYGGVVDNQLRVLEHLGVFRVNWMAEAHAAIRKELKDEGLDSSSQTKRFGEITATRDQRPAPPTSLLFQRPERYAKLPDPYDETQEVAARARSYLHSNCAQCHVAAGGGNAQIDLAYNTPLDNMKVIDLAPLHHKYDLTDPRIIAPGHPERSVLLHRIAIRGPGQMPQLATAVVDERAVDVLRRWIAGLPPTAEQSKP